MRNEVGKMRYAKFFVITAMLLAGAFAANALAADPGFSKGTAIHVGFNSTITGVDSSLSTKTDHAARCGADSNGHVVWYTATAPATGTATADTVGSDYDTVLNVYKRGKFLACNDDTSGTTSEVTFDVVAGKQYYFKVAAYDGDAGGDTVLHLSGVTPPP
jgi:hypothetical protein